MKFGLGIFGYSSIARRRLIPAARKCDDFKLTFLASRIPSSTPDIAAQLGIEQYGDYRELLASEAVDVAYISTPPSQHYANVIDVLTSGKHVICEKPISLNLGEAEEICQLARKKNLGVFENYAFLRHPQHRYIKAILSKQLIGDLKSIEIRFSYPLPSPGDIRLSSNLCGGVLNDSLGYPFALLDYLFDDPVITENSSIEQCPIYKVPRLAKGHLRIGQTIKALIHVEMGAEYESTYRIQGARGQIDTSRAFSVDEGHSVSVQISGSVDDSRKVFSDIDQFLLYLNTTGTYLREQNYVGAQLEILRIRRAMDQFITFGHQR